MYLKLESGSLMKDAWEGEDTECYNIKVKNCEKTGEEIEQMEQIKELCPSKRKDETSTKRATRMEIKVKKGGVSDRQNQ